MYFSKVLFQMYTTPLVANKIFEYRACLVESFLGEEMHSCSGQFEFLGNTMVEISMQKFW